MKGNGGADSRRRQARATLSDVAKYGAAGFWLETVSPTKIHDAALSTIGNACFIGVTMGVLAAIVQALFDVKGRAGLPRR